ncbi:MAG: FMN-binding protein [Thermomicrobiales bacterium]
MKYEPSKRPNTPPPQRTGAAPSAPNAAKAKGGGKNKKIANSLVALGSAAILSVYGLGYVRTDAAQAIYNLDTPAIAIATAAPAATTAPSSSVAAYQSPLYPTPAATSPSDGSAQVVASATATTAQPTATTPAATASAPTTTVKAPATATTSVQPTATTTAATTTKAPAAASTTSSAATTSLYKDGTYTGTGTSRHGNITASVVVQGGKIVSAAITQCGTRYPCSDIAALPGQVVSRQSATIDTVSGATDSSQAYRGAIQTALAKAKVTA